jgi:hypothetical protein
LAQWEQFGKRKNEEEKREKSKKRLTLTGLLMEGFERQEVTGVLTAFAFRRCTKTPSQRG